ncbi:MAG: metallophosphoesterase [Candidatus ainarchaeum sp.]|nr:metallophosphoesterase [Candidatus ainarchaeum sp.]
MKIAIIADSHLGYARFEEDSFIQAENALENAGKNADLIIIAGDVFDTKIPKMENLERAIKLFKKINIPIFAIHGNHERRSRDSVNVLKLLESSGALTYLHNNSIEIEIHGEKIHLVGLGNIPSGYVKEGLSSVVNNNPVKKDYLNILVLHQNINELSIGEPELSIEELEELDFEIIINGHIHKHHIKLNGKLIIPGSTVVTQLKEEEQGKRGYVLYDSKKKLSEFIPIECREFRHFVLEFENSGINEINEKINRIINEIKDDEIGKIIIKGSLKEGLNSGDISINGKSNVFIDNKLNSKKTLKEKIDEIKKIREGKMSLKEFASVEIQKRAKGKIPYEPSELFDKLASSIEEAEKYIGE